MNEKRIALLGRQILEALCFLTDCGPSRAKSASRSWRRALLMPQVNPGSLYRCGKGLRPRPSK